MSTADLSDERGEAVVSCHQQFRQFGAIKEFDGPVTTVKCFEDNTALREVLTSPGAGGVVVVDGAGSVRCALLGDQMAQLAIDSGWAGIILNAAVRDVQALSSMLIGIKATGTNPRRSGKTGLGSTNLPVSFGGATFRSGDHLWSDDDGILIATS